MIHHLLLLKLLVRCEAKLVMEQKIFRLLQASIICFDEVVGLFFHTCAAIWSTGHI